MIKLDTVKKAKDGTEFGNKCGPAHPSGLGIPEAKMLSSLPKAI